MAAGAEHGLFVTSPNRIRRIEAGILDYGVDMDETTTPFEVGLGRLVDLRPTADYIGKAALQAAGEPARRLVGLLVEGAPVAPNDEAYPVRCEERPVGRMTSWVHSPRLGANIALAMVETGAADLGTALTVAAPQGLRQAEVVPQPFHDAKRALSKS